MPGEFTLTILAPDKRFLSGPAQQVIFSTPKGRAGVMAGHMHMIAAVAEGTLDILMEGEWKTAAASQGFVEVDTGKVDFFLDTVEWADEIDIARAQESLERAEIRLRGEVSRLEYVRAKAAVARAMARIKAADRQRH